MERALLRKRSGDSLARKISKGDAAGMMIFRASDSALLDAN
jgi:hypothetical protein